MSSKERDKKHCFLKINRATGYSTMKIGKTAAFLIGSSILLLEVAHEQGLIKIDWNKVSKKVDQVGDKVEEAVTGEGPKWMDKVNTFFCIRKLL